jgi:hypothetical protein
MIPQSFKDGENRVKEEKYTQGEFDQTPLYTCI